MRLVIVTGMSGAGKTSALKMLEDLGFYCVDNLPIPLMEAFVELVMQKPAAHEEVALGIDIRSGEELPQLEQVLENWKAQQVPYEILFLDSSDATLVKRYKETRRSHPLAGKGRVDSGIQLEREKLAFIKQQADMILDTSSLLTRELRSELEKSLSRTAGIRTCLSRCCPLDLSMASRMTQILFSMYVFFQIPTMWRHCAATPVRRRRCRRMSARAVQQTAFFPCCTGCWIS